MNILFKNSKRKKNLLPIYNDCILQILSLVNDSIGIVNLSEEEIESAIAQVDNVAATYDYAECKLLSFKHMFELFCCIGILFVGRIYFLMAEISLTCFSQ